MAITALAGLMGALKSTKDIFESIIDVRDAAVFQAKQLELQSKIIDAQNAVFDVNQERTELLSKVAELEHQIATLRNWEEEKQHYKRALIAQQVVAYIPRDDEDSKTADHWLCANCFEDQRKTYLQQGPLSAGRSTIAVCPRCKSVSYTQGQAIADHANILGKFTK